MGVGEGEGRSGGEEGKGDGGEEVGGWYKVTK